MISFILTFVVGAAIGCIFFKMKIPGGMMIGALCGSALLNITASAAFMPDYGKYAAQITAGAFIGTTISKDDIRQIRFLLFPILTLFTCLLTINIFMGFLIWKISDLDLITALMGCLPGGMSDVPIISADMGADGPKVSAMQFCRMIIGIGLFPSLISAISHSQKTAKNEEAYNESKTSRKNSKSVKITLNEIKALAVTFAVALCGGLLGKLLGMPGGMLLFSMFAVLILKLCSNKAYMPTWARRTAQILAGTYIGSSMVYQDLVDLSRILLPVIILAIGYFINCCATGFILHKKFGFSMAEAMLVATPAGASDMALISADMGIKSQRITVMQVMRLLLVIAVFPQIMHFIASLY